MRKIITITYVTLDGVMQGPGGPEEDTSNGFTHGGWQMEWKEEDPIADDIMTKFMAAPFDLLLGRRTYDIWAAFWPHQDDPFWGKPINKATKYVVTHKPFELTWDKTEIISDDVVQAIKKLKDTDGPDLVVWGSADLIQTLLKHNLIDRMHIWTYPLTLGTGKKLFAEGTPPQWFTPVDAKITSTGLLVATYEPSHPLKK